MKKGQSSTRPPVKKILLKGVWIKIKVLANKFRFVSMMKLNSVVQTKLPTGLIILMLAFGWSCYSHQDAAPQLIKDSLVFIYPPEARTKHLEGTVMLRILIDEEGNVNEASVLKSSGYDILDQTALNVAKGARFKPARIRGKKHSVWISWPLIFEITAMRFIPEEWTKQAINLQQEAESNNSEKRAFAQQAIYYHYKDFATNMVENRNLLLNKTALAVVLPKVRRQWQEYEEAWPLTFVLFQDYILRYPDSPFRHEAEDYLVEYIKNEIFQLKVRGVSERLPKNLRDKFIQSLVAYLKQAYPERVPDDLLKNYPND